MLQLLIIHKSHNLQTYSFIFTCVKLQKIFAKIKRLSLVSNNKIKKKVWNYFFGLLDNNAHKCNKNIMNNEFLTHGWEFKVDNFL